MSHQWRICNLSKEFKTFYLVGTYMKTVMSFRVLESHYYTRWLMIVQELLLIRHHCHWKLNVQCLLSNVYHPPSTIRLLPSAFYHPPSTIYRLLSTSHHLSTSRHPLSSIHHLTFTLYHPPPPIFPYSFTNFKENLHYQSENYGMASAFS